MQTSSKLIDLGRMPNFIGYRFVLAHGCFDCLHLGHVRHLQSAAKLGTALFVTVTADRYVGKGEGRPVFTAAERCEMLAALACVDFVAVSDAPTAVEAIRVIRPAVFAKGAEYGSRCTHGLVVETDAVQAVGGRVVFTQTPEIHTTDLLQK